MTDRNAQTQFMEFHTANRPWRMLIPPVYRYLEEEYVDRFFDTGELRLSSFRQFAKHPDEARLDSEEGRSILRAIGPNKELWALTLAGQRAYVLCGSTIQSQELMGIFSGAGAAIEITNIPDFALAIAWQLRGFRGGVSGHCIYGDKTLTRHVPNDPLTLPDPPGDMTFEHLFGAVAHTAQDEDLLLKPARYASQAEYRFMWHVDHDAEDHIIVSSLEATRACRKVLPADLA